MADTPKYPKYIWMDEEFVPFEQATVHVLSPCARNAANVFEGIRGYWNSDRNELFCFRLPEHYKRLFESMRIMHMELPYSIANHTDFLLQTLRKNEIREDVHIRHQVLVNGIGYFSSTEPVSMFIATMPRPSSPQIEKGTKCCISAWTRISDDSVPPRVKAGANYQNSRLAKIWASKFGFEDTILLNRNGKVAEGPAACLFMVRNGKLITPSVTQGILESVTRDTIIELAKKEMGIDVIEREIDRTELYVAEEAFFVGTAAEVKPIIEIDGFKLKSLDSKSLTRRIQRCFFDVARGYNPEYSDWLTPVYGA
jgi:branched-chain amino acid aminotransferase